MASWVLILVFALQGNSAWSQDGPLGEWPDFTPLGFITSAHPQNPDIQTHLYGDWGGIVGEEFLVIQDSLIQLIYHSYHESCLSQRLLQEDLLADWEPGFSPVTLERYPPLVSPGGPIPGSAWNHTDTPAYIQHPLTGEHLLYNTVRPGTKFRHPEWDDIPGYESSIQVATSDTIPRIGEAFSQDYQNILEAELWWETGWNNSGVIRGGLSEPTPVWVPHLGEAGKIRLFYRGLHGTEGSYWNWRISYADSDDGKTDWIKNPTPSWDPADSQNPAHRWTLPWPEGFGFRGAWQAHCTGDTLADGVHMVMSVSNQNLAGFGHLAYYWSPDWGDTWISHPDNPIIAPGQFENGVPAQGFQRTPSLVIDEQHQRYILAWNAGHDLAESWRRRTYLATASRPTQVAVERKNTAQSAMPEMLDLQQNTPNPFNPVTRISYSLTVSSHVKLVVYNVMGQEVEILVAAKQGAGDYELILNASKYTSGLYFYRLSAPGGISKTRKLVLLK